MSLIRQALCAGLLLGVLWGGLEALVVLLGPWHHFSMALGRPAPFDLVEASAVMALAAWRYVPVLALLALGLTPIVIWVERRVRAWGGGALVGADDPALAASRGLVALAVFAHLYWYTKPLWAFSWGLPFHHPKRLALTAAWALAGWIVACLVVRPGSPLRAPGPRVSLLLLALVVGAGGWATLREQRLTAPPTLGAGGARSPNVLLVVVDALRADRLGCYGHERSPPVSPRVDALAAEGVVFERAMVQAPFTWTSFGSMLTGKYPRQHGLIKMSPDQKLDPQRNRTLAEALQEQGYATGAFLTGTLSHGSGLLEGFDTYFESIQGHERVNRHSKWSIVRSRLLLSILFNKARQALDPRLVNTEALAWIDEVADQPFFAMVHYYSTHTPYDPPAPYDTLYDPDYAGPWHPFFQSHGVWIMKQQKGEGVCELDGLPVWECDHFDPRRDVEHVRALYDGGVAFADEMFGSLLDLLDERGLDDDTLVVFTSDHGEELYDHGIFEHDWMFETNLRIPLVMRLPGRAHAGTRVPWNVEELDVPATVLDVVGRGSMATSDVPALPSRSLLPDMAGIEPGPDERWTASENVRYVAVQDDRFKLIRNRFERDSLRAYDLLADPDELCPLDLSDPANAATRAMLLARWEAYDAGQPDASRFSSGKVDVELFRQLANLGYTAGVPEAALDGLTSGEAVDVEALLGDTTFLGSNEILEESLQTQRWQWPPGRDCP